MLRIIQNSSAAGAKGYYTKADYYTEGQELAGRWRGAGARLLNLDGSVEQQAWDLLCENRHPYLETPLTARTNHDRRVGYDFNFHVPKSVSLLHALTQDERIVEALRYSVDSTMTRMESEMKTRVRKRGRDEDRTTGNMVWGEFIHTTSRPIDGRPDPHLHAHCFVFNVTHDGKEQRWKAAQFGDLKRDARYFEAVFHGTLSHALAKMGLPIERTKHGWELAGVGKATRDKFSRRTAEIETLADRLGITDPDEKSNLGAKTRKHKADRLTAEQLVAEWTSRLSDDERNGLDRLHARLGSEPTPTAPDAARTAATRAVDHAFARQSVVAERALLADALRGAYGAASPDAVETAIQQQHLIHATRDGRRVVTTREVLDEEQAMIAFARDGRGTCAPLAPGDHVFARDWLNADQRAAVSHVLRSPDRVIYLRGGAGVGKTTAIVEAADAIRAAGTGVFTFAPSADASRNTLRKEGFAEADTVARLLVDEKLQARCANGVLWIDECGLVSVPMMRRIFDLAEAIDARVVLSGDPRQHASVERGSALRLLEQEAGVIPAEIREIQRQRGAYKNAVHALSEGRVVEGFKQLDRLGWVREIPHGERYEALAHDYMDVTQDGSSALIVSPTHAEAARITSEIRQRLIDSGRLSSDARSLDVLTPMHLTVAERGDPTSFQAGDVVIFQNNAPGYRKQTRLVVGKDAIPHQHAARFAVFRPKRLPVAVGETLRVTHNGKSLADQRLDNGSMFTVADFTPGGDVVLNTGQVMPKDFGHVAHGYVVTSHISQGRTVQHVLIGQSAESFPASSREQFYVSVSRGRQSCRVYTDSKADLLDAVQRSQERVAATDLLSPSARERAFRQRRIREQPAWPRPTPMPPTPERSTTYDR